MFHSLDVNSWPKRIHTSDWSAFGRHLNIKLSLTLPTKYRRQKYQLKLDVIVATKFCLIPYAARLTVCICGCIKLSWRFFFSEANLIELKRLALSESPTHSWPHLRNNMLDHVTGEKKSILKQQYQMILRNVTVTSVESATMRPLLVCAECMLFVYNYVLSSWATH